MPTVYSKTDVPPRESMEYWTEVVAKGKHTMPVLAIGADKSFGTAMADDLRFVAENVSAAVIANSGHWLMEEQPAATVAAVRAFLDRKP